MATYVLPQVLVFQDIDLATNATVRRQSAHISGGHAHLVRYSEEDERADGLLGTYDRLIDTDYDWPNRPAGAIVDRDYTVVHIKDALLRYYTHSIGTGDTIRTVAGYSNRIRASATIWKTANGNDRDADLQNRDVTVGDTVKIRAVVGGDTYDLCTYVAGFKAEQSAAVTAAATAASDNQATVSDDWDVTRGGPVNCVDVTDVDTASYDGRPTGDVTETYTVTVIESSADGDATTARLRVVSASGNDDQSSVTPAAFGDPTAIGTRGLTVTWDNTDTGACSLSADNESIDIDDFQVGQSWTVEVTQAFTAPTATSGGTYTGTADDTYVVEVIRGGSYSVDTSVAPLIRIRTTRGTDTSGPHAVTASGSAVSIGSKGLTVAFNQTGLSKDDRYYIVATAAADAEIQTLILGHNLPEEVIDNGATDVDLHLYIRKDLEITANRTDAPPETNYEQGDTQITIASGITAFDSTWTDDDGEPEALPVHAECDYGQVYVTVRYWRSDLCDEVNEIYDVADLDDAISGSLHPDNELKWGVYSALLNSNGVPVAYTSVCDPSDSDSWIGVLDLIEGRPGAYNLVPLTRNATVWGLFEAHVNSQSSPEQGSWRRLWLNSDDVSELLVVDESVSTDAEQVLAVVEDDPLTSGTQYTQLRVPANNAAFVDNDVAAGDIVRLLYGTDGFGNDTYEEFVVDAVINQSTLRLVAGPDTAISVPERMEVWRTLSNTQRAEQLALTGGVSNRLVSMVWPDTFLGSGYTQTGYFLCAILGGLASGVAPHQSLTHLSISGVTSVPRTTSLSRSQLDTMAGGGMHIVTQDPTTGAVYSRHAITTATTGNLADTEEMVVRNLDSISAYFLDLYSPYIGVSNVTETLLETLRAETLGGLKYLQGANRTQRLGGQLIDGTIADLRRHTTLRDRVVIALDLELPFPLNNLEVRLRLVA